MHICIITHEYPKPGFAHGGIGSFLKTLAPKMVANGVKVTIVGLSYDYKYDYQEDQGVIIYRLAYKNVKHLGWYYGVRAISKKIAEIHKEQPIDIVEASELGLAFLDKIKGIKYIIRLHGGHHFFAESENRKINWWKGFQEKLSFENADGFIAISNYVKSHTEKYLSFHNKPVAYISNLIDTDFFSPRNNPINPYSIVFMGSVCEKKGVRQLVQAFPMVREQFPQATLELYGREWFFPDGTSYTNFLQNEVISKLDSHVAAAIHFHGQVNYEDVPEKYAKAHVCVFPSHMETQGLVAPEAMAMQKTVVFTNKGPGPEAITPYETGLLCDPLDPKDIAEKIIWVFSNPEQSEVMASNARQFVLEKYSAAVIVQKNIAFFTTLTNSN
jgi:glycosyltransferase involved in cell wall biosynthesis